MKRNSGNDVPVLCGIDGWKRGQFFSRFSFRVFGR